MPHSQSTEKLKPSSSSEKIKSPPEEKLKQVPSTEKIKSPPEEFAKPKVPATPRGSLTSVGGSPTKVNIQKVSPTDDQPDDSAPSVAQQVARIKQV